MTESNVSLPPARIFSKKEVFAFGWRATLDHLALLATVVVVAFVFTVVLDLAESSASAKGLALQSIILNIAAIALGVAIELGLVNVALRIARGESIAVRSFFEPIRFFFVYLVASIFFTFTVIGGLILLIVPGIVWAVMFSMYAYALVDESLGPIEAMKRSAVLTKGARGQLALFFLAVLGINILGALALGVGLVVTLPATMIATARVYYILRQRLEPAIVPAPNVGENSVLAPTNETV